MKKKNEEAAAIWVDIETLTPWEDNPRNNNHAVEGVAKSIERFGFASPIIAREENGEVIAGHTRLKAAASLGLQKVPVRYLDLDPADSKLLALADNRLGELADWDEVRLAEILEELRAENAELEFTGWDDSEIQDLIDSVADPVEGLTDPDEIPELPEEPITKTGDLWQLGDHRLLCGDSTKAEDVNRLMNGAKADMVFTDPPYGMNLDTDYSKMGTSTKAYRPVHDDNKPFDAGAMMRLLPSPVYYIWGADYFCDSIPNWRDGSTLVWAKAHSEKENKVFGSSFELCWRYPKAKKEVWFVRRIHMTNEHLKAHPTQKPCDLPVRAIEKDSEPNQTIVDLFGGSGTTLIACEKTKRIARLMELDSAYCDVIVKRWEDFTGKKAELLKNA